MYCQLALGAVYIKPAFTDTVRGSSMAGRTGAHFFIAYAVDLATGAKGKSPLVATAGAGGITDQFLAVDAGRLYIIIRQFLVVFIYLKSPYQLIIQPVEIQPV